MFSGSTIMACLLLAANAGEPEVPPLYWPSNRLAFPVNLERPREEISKIVLSISDDGGKTWSTCWEGPPPPDKKIPVSVPKDGCYCFSVATVYKQGDTVPPQPAIGRKIIFDSTKPDIHLKAWRDNDKIVFNWDIHEANPNKPTLKLEYQMADGTNDQWYKAPIVHAGFKGEESFVVPSQGAVKLRMTLTDLANNVGVGDAAVPAVGSSVVPATAGDLHPPEPYRPTPPPIGGPPPSVIASEKVPGGGHYGPNNGAPPVKVVKTQLLKVEFDVERCGPSGLGKADVYLSTDDGGHWEIAQRDLRVMGPDGNPGLRDVPIRGASVMVNLPHEEVVYGIYLVVKSGAGLGEAPPQSGRPPQMRVEVDNQAPTAYLLQPLADPNQENGVILLWKAFDRNPETNPITLEYGDTPSGPWKPIGPPALPNTGGDGKDSTGKFAWTIPYDLNAGRAYLRLTVRDLAGNVALIVSNQAILFDTVRPKPVNIRPGA